MTGSEEELAFAELTPDQMLDAVESVGFTCDGRFLALNSYENRVFQVYLDDGDRLVAKFYRPHRWTDSQIQEEHAFTLELATHELPVIPPLEVQSQTLFKHGKFHFALFECRGGRSAELDNPEHLFQLGRFVGRLHSVSANRAFVHRPRVDPTHYFDEPCAWLLENRYLPDYLCEAYSSTIAMLRRQIFECYQRAGNYKSIRLHADCHWGNILWRDDGPLVVDFDDCRSGPAIQDLWLFLSGDREYMQQGMMDLLEGYEEFCEFDARELNLVEALRTMRLVHHAGWLARRWNDPAFPRAFPWFNTDQFWQQHILNLKEQSALMNEEPIRISGNL